MEETKKNKPNWFRIIMIILFVSYISLYVLNTTGYYNGSIKRKVEFTNEQIRLFESDVEAGKEVDINDYLKDKNKNYVNGASRLGYNVSASIDKLLNKGIKKFVKLLNKLLS